MINPKVAACIHSYIEDGVALEDLQLTPQQVARVKLAEKVYDRLKQDPMLDVMHCLRRAYGRSASQAKADMEVVGMFVSTLEGVDRALAEFRARKVAENIIRIGQQTGDWKPMKAGLDKLIQIGQLDKPEETAENIGNRTYNLPPVFVRVEAVDSKYQTVTEEQRIAIIRKYGGVEDMNMAMVKRKALELAKPANDDEEDVAEAQEVEWDE